MLSYLSYGNIWQRNSSNPWPTTFFLIITSDMKIISSNSDCHAKFFFYVLWLSCVQCLKDQDRGCCEVVMLIIISEERDEPMQGLSLPALPQAGPSLLSTRCWSSSPGWRPTSASVCRAGSRSLPGHQPGPASGAEPGQSGGGWELIRSSPFCSSSSPLILLPDNIITNDSLRHN